MTDNVRAKKDKTFAMILNKIRLMTLDKKDPDVWKYFYQRLVEPNYNNPEDPNMEIINENIRKETSKLQIIYKNQSNEQNITYVSYFNA